MCTLILLLSIANNFVRHTGKLRWFFLCLNRREDFLHLKKKMKNWKISKLSQGRCVCALFYLPTVRFPIRKIFQWYPDDRAMWVNRQHLHRMMIMGDTIQFVQLPLALISLLQPIQRFTQRKKNDMKSTCHLFLLFSQQRNKV